MTKMTAKELIEFLTDVAEKTKLDLDDVTVKFDDGYNLCEISDEIYVNDYSRCVILKEE